MCDGKEEEEERKKNKIEIFVLKFLDCEETVRRSNGTLGLDFTLK